MVSYYRLWYYDLECYATSLLRKMPIIPNYGYSIIISDEKDELLLEIYPNPVNQNVAVEFSELVNVTKVEILDLSGKVIWVKNFEYTGRQLGLTIPKGCQRKLPNKNLYRQRCFIRKTCKTITNQLYLSALHVKHSNKN